MQCPGCERNVLSAGHRMRVALRLHAHCPTCGIAIRFGFLPRLVHSLLGDALLVGGVVGAFLWQMPILVPVAATSWVSLALLLPVETMPQRPNRGRGNS